MSPSIGKLRHVVLFKFKDSAAEEEVRAVEDHFRSLKDRIADILDFEWGTDMSEERLAQGFTHCFLVTFEDAASRDRYLPHPEHKRFVEHLNQILDKALVVDYIAVA
jgi:hypothetical protein